MMHWSARHERAPLMYFWLLPHEDPFDRIVRICAKIPTGFPTEGWRVAPEELICPFGCGAANHPYYLTQTIELYRDRAGQQTIVCNCCGKAGPVALADNGVPVLLSGARGPS